MNTAKKFVALLLPFLVCFQTGSRAGETASPSEASSDASLVADIRLNPTNRFDRSELETKERAIRKAGETRNTARAVIEALLDDIGYLSPLAGSATALMAPKYKIEPAWDALISIGEPAIPQILERIKRGEDELPKGFVRSPTEPIEYVPGTSNRVIARMPIPRLKPGEFAALRKEKRFSRLLREIAGPRAADLLHQAIKEAEEQKQHLEKSLETVRSLKP